MAILSVPLVNRWIPVHRLKFLVTSHYTMRHQAVHIGDTVLTGGFASVVA